MRDEADHTRRWLINASGAAILSGAIPAAALHAQTAAAPQALNNAPAPDGALEAAGDAVYGLPGHDRARGLCGGGARSRLAGRGRRRDQAAYPRHPRRDGLGLASRAGRLRRPLWAQPRRQSAGDRSRTPIVASAVNAVLANAMAAHADETDDTHPIGPVHLGCGAVPAALATAELAGRSGRDLMRAVTLGYDIGARMVSALGGGTGIAHHSPSCLIRPSSPPRPPPRCCASTAAGPLHVLLCGATGLRHRLLDARPRARRKGFRFRRDGRAQRRHRGDHGGDGIFGGRDPFGGDRDIYTALGRKAGAGKAPRRARIKLRGLRHHDQEMVGGLAAAVGARFRRGAARGSRGTRRQHPPVRMEVPAGTIRIVDNATSPDLCPQHLVALMIVDRGATFAGVHDVSRMCDPKVLALRELVELVPSRELQVAVPARQAIVRHRDGGRALAQAVEPRWCAARREIRWMHERSRPRRSTWWRPSLGADRAHALIAAVGDLERARPGVRTARDGPACTLRAPLRRWSGRAGGD